MALNYNLTEILKTHQLLANKAFGQHFLKDINVARKMIRHLSLQDKVVVEIGPGVGSLTHVLLEKPFKFLLTIEKDQRFLPILNDLTKGVTNFACINEDALNISIADILKKTDKYLIIANLPYNIGTELLVRWIFELPYIDSITVMLQKEVVDRICAAANTASYGRLSILIQNCFKVQPLFSVAPQSFIPPPKVWSKVVYLKPVSPLPNFEVIKNLEKLTRIVFSGRRKMLRTTLGKKLPLKTWQTICDNLKIDECQRPETLTPSTFYQMANELITI